MAISGGGDEFSYSNELSFSRSDELSDVGDPFSNPYEASREKSSPSSLDFSRILLISSANNPHQHPSPLRFFLSRLKIPPKDEKSKFQKKSLQDQKLKLFSPCSNAWIQEVKQCPQLD